jgi:hypothetical protein
MSASLPYFDIRQMTDMLIVLTPRQFFDPATLHNLLIRTDLRVPVWLLLQSNMDFQRAARAAGWTASADPEVLYHAAVGLIAERRFEEALGPLERASRFAEKKGWADALRICALAELGRIAEARELGAQLATARAPIPPGFWQKLQTAYGPPTAPVEGRSPPKPGK